MFSKTKLHTILGLVIVSGLLCTTNAGAATPTDGIRRPQTEAVASPSPSPNTPQPNDSQIEEIVLYDSRIIVLPDSSMEVTENITVNARHLEIKRGIYRDYPTVYAWKYGLDKKVGFEVKEIKRDDRQEPYHIENQSNGTRIYIGDSNEFVPQGIHTYTITYKTTQQLGNFQNHDELYYNITGNGWVFPIQRVTASVVLPQKYSDEQLETFGFTGSQGSKDANLYAQVGEENGKTIIKYTSTQTFSAYEGMTIVAQWPKGAVTYPADYDGWLRVLKDNIATFLFIPLNILLAFYYLYTWWRHGRDPEKGPIVPQFYPPENLSPAAMRFIYSENNDPKSLSATFVQYGVEGLVSIEEVNEKVLLFNKKYFVIRRTDRSKSPATDAEKNFIDRLFPAGKDTLELGKEYDYQFSIDKEAFFKEITDTYEKKHFIRNARYNALGAAISYFGLLLIVLFANLDKGLSLVSSLPFLAFFSVFWIFGLIFLYFTGRASGPGKLILALFANIWIGFITFMIVSVTGVFTLLLAFLLLVQIAIHTVFILIMQSRTVEGSRIRDQLEGFRMYLSAAENDDLIVMNKETPDTFEIYQKYLPYAIVFDVETNWTKRFEKIISAAEMDGSYQNSYLYAGGLASFSNASSISSFSSSMSSAISSASTAPGSSGSGGSSGGGGGGGGGGGW
jgi:uncharacterized membrane protein YgcG